jgi:hypothetical protein
MSHQMLKIESGKSDYVDLYYNDLYGLRKSIN